MDSINNASINNVDVIIDDDIVDLGDANNNIDVELDSTPEEATSPFQPNRKRSNVWDHFNLVEVEPKNGKKQYRAICNYCSKSLVAGSGNGTTHLKRHANDTCTARGNKDIRQMQLSRSSNGSIENFVYNPTRARQNIVSYIVKKELPYMTSEDKDFEHMVKTSFCPQFVGFSRNTTRNDLLKLFKMEKEKLRTVFQNYSGNVCLTTDLWKSSQDLEYLCLTAHYIDQNWCLQKRIISFKLVELPYSGYSIGKSLMLDIDSWNLRDKVFSITVDNVGYNTTMVHFMKTGMSSLPLFGELFHVRCCAHILNLIVKDGLAIIGPSVQKLRKLPVLIRSSPKRLEMYKNACRSVGLSYKALPLDISIRWNSTYMLLKVALKYKRAIEAYFLSLPRDIQITQQLDEEDWVNGAFLRYFSKVFDESTKIFCGVYYPTSCKVLHQLVNIIVVFREYENKQGYTNILVAMKEKLDKYWKDLPNNFALAIMMDPRYKKEMFESLFKFVYGDHTSAIRYQTILYALFEEYKHKIKTNLDAPIQIQTSLHEGDFATRLLKRAKIAHVTTDQTSELQLYITSPLIDEDEGVTFDVLAWWKGHEKTYPVLSAMARDILTIPVTTVASESAFSAGGRTLGTYRSRLTPEMLEINVCLKDWMHADSRTQDQEEKEIEVSTMQQMTHGEEIIYNDCDDE